MCEPEDLKTVRTSRKNSQVTRAREVLGWVTFYEVSHVHVSQSRQFHVESAGAVTIAISLLNCFLDSVFEKFGGNLI